MDLFPVGGVLLGLSSAAYNSTPQRKSSSGLAHRKNLSFINWKLFVYIDTLNGPQKLSEG